LALPIQLISVGTKLVPLRPSRRSIATLRANVAMTVPSLGDTE